jgi:hypothetical protein
MGTSGCFRLGGNRQTESINANHIGFNSLSGPAINADPGERAARLIPRLVVPAGERALERDVSRLPARAQGRLKMDEYLDRMGHASGASRPTSPAARAIDLRPARDHHTDPSATCNPEITLSHYFRVGPGGRSITDMSSMPPQCIQPSLVRQ